MRSIQNIINEKAEQLLSILDKDAEHLQKTFNWLEQIRVFIVRRDEPAFTALLEQIREESADYAFNEQQRQLIRGELAELLHCPTAELNLSKLEGVLDNNIAAQIRFAKNNLRTLASRFKNEHRNTAELIADCARFNHFLLKTIFKNQNDESITYKRNGASENVPNATFLYTKF